MLATTKEKFVELVNNCIVNAYNPVIKFPAPRNKHMIIA